MELVCREFVIEQESGAGHVVARDHRGVVVASGASASEVIRSVQALVCGASGQMIPWSALMRFRPDGRVGLTGTYRVMNAQPRRGC